MYLSVVLVYQVSFKTFDGNRKLLDDAAQEISIDEILEEQKLTLGEDQVIGVSNLSFFLDYDIDELNDSPFITIKAEIGGLESEYTIYLNRGAR